MQNTMGQDLIDTCLKRMGIILNKNNIRDLINESYYFGYKWKSRLEYLTNYTHQRPIYKLIISDNFYTLEKITTIVAMKDFKIVNVDVYTCYILPNEIQITLNYQNNITIVEQYMLDESKKYRINHYQFKILENNEIFSIMDSNYNIIKHTDDIDSTTESGYLKSSIKISSLLDNFIAPYTS